MSRINYGFDGATQVVENLWVGSRPPERPPGFDLVVLCEKEYQPAWRDGGWLIRCPFEDVALDNPTFEKLKLVARAVATAIQHEEKTLIACFAGRNRSGLVAALTLIELGRDAGEAVELVRHARGNTAYGPALDNPSFLRALGVNWLPGSTRLN